MSTEVVKGVCLTCAVAGCGVTFEVENGKITKVRGDKDHPISRGMMCPKGVATPEIISHPERLLHPLKRDGKKGAGKWKRISWDEALDEIADNLTRVKNKYGAEAFAFGSGISSITVGFNWYIALFLHLFGSPNHVRGSHI